MTDSEMNELKSSVPVKQETNVFHQTSLKNRAIDDWNDFCVDQLKSEWDDLDYETQYAIARQANKSVNDYFDGDTEASYEDYEEFKKFYN